MGAKCLCMADRGFAIYQGRMEGQVFLSCFEYSTGDMSPEAALEYAESCDGGSGHHTKAILWLRANPVVV